MSYYSTPKGHHNHPLQLVGAVGAGYEVVFEVVDYEEVFVAVHKSWLFSAPTVHHSHFRLVA